MNTNLDWARNRGIVSSILDTAGHTPLVRLNRVARANQPLKPLSA